MQLLREEEQLVLNTVKNMVNEKIVHRAAEIDRDGVFPEDIKEMFREIELMGVCMPEELGGFGGSTLLFSMVLEEIAKVCLNSSNIISQQDLGMQPIFIAGNEEQKEKYLKPMVSGEYLGAFALTEPNAGSDQNPISTRAVLDGDEYVINGNKCFITWGNQADVITVFAKTTPDVGVKGLSAFIVEKGTPGLKTGKLEDKMGLRGSPTAEVFFEDCRIPKENLLGKENEGFKICLQALNHGRVAIASQAVGLAQGALDYAINYTQERTQFGRKISQFQGIRFKVADLLTEIEAARQLTYRAALEIDRNGSQISKYGAMAKMYSTDVAMRVTVEAVQLLGGYGYMREFPLERMMRDAKILQIVEGTNEIQKIIISNLSM